MCSYLFSNRSQYMMEHVPFPPSLLQESLGSSKFFMHAVLSRFSSVWLLTPCDPWTAACQTPLSLEFSRQEYWSGLPCPPPPGSLPSPGIEPVSLTSSASLRFSALAGRVLTTGAPGFFIFPCKSCHQLFNTFLFPTHTNLQSCQNWIIVALD